MSKIYSRPRLKIPKLVINKKVIGINTSKKRNIIWIIIIAFFTVKIVLDSVLPIFNELCENRAISIATIISNEQATEVMKNYTYDQLFVIEKDENGNITMIKSNVISINKITSEIGVKIQEEINKRGKEDIEIALR